MRGGENLFPRHAIALHGAAGAQAAVVALADAVAGDLDEAAQVDVVSDVLAAHSIGAFEELPQRRGVVLAQPADEFFMGYVRHAAAPDYT